MYGNAAIDEFAPQQLEDLVDEIVRIHRLELHFTALEEQTQATDDVSRSLIVGNDLPEDIAHFIQIRFGTLEDAVAPPARCSRSRSGVG